jgi:guanine deaminase
MVYGTVFKDSVNVFFEESEKLGTRMLCGKVLMDRNAPEEILDTAESGYNESKELIEKWHNNGRQLYVITPRFAPTSTREQLKLAGKLFNEYPDVFMQTHLCENEGEIAWVKELFPERKSYLDVYDYYGLVGKRAVFGHCVHFEDEDFETMSKKKAAISHCPTSNLFLGSGLFDLKKAKTGKHPVAVGLGTDLGAGTSFSQLQTLNEAYKIAEMRGNALTAIQGYFLATRGGAESLGLEDKIGSLEKGMEADITIWNLASTEIIDYRLTFAKDLEEKLFVQMILADDRSVHATYVNGEKVYDTKNNYYKLD